MDDIGSILRDGPWTIGGRSMILKIWSQDFKFSNKEM